MKVTTRMINEWVELYTVQRWNASKIAEKYNVSRGIVCIRLKERGVQLTRKCRKRPHSQITILIYNKDDTLMYFFESIVEMAEALKIDLQKIRVAIAHVKRGYTQSIILNKHRYKTVVLEEENENS